MSFINILIIAAALSFDAMAVGAANGARHHRMTFGKAFQIAFCFGFFQFLMPLIGMVIGTGFLKIISKFDNWVAFVMLVALGVKMILESFDTSPEKQTDIHDFKVLLFLAVATSIDALVVGVTFALLPVKIFFTAVIIGISTFVFSLASIYIGKFFGARWGKRSEVVGGIILILLGVKILLSHLYGI